MRPLSLTVRVTLLTVTIIAIVIVVVSAAAYHELRESLVRMPDQRLRTLAEAIGPGLEVSPAEPTQEDVQAVLKQAPPLGTVDLLVWSEGAGPRRIVHASPGLDVRAWSEALRPSMAPAVGQHRLLTVAQEGRPCRAAWFRYAHAKGTLSVLVIAHVNYAQREMDEFLRILLIFGATMLLVAGGAAVLSIVWAMRPIRITAARLDQVTHRNLDLEPLAGISTPVELAPFVRSVRAMLARVNEGVQSQKRFVAEASHELRTPLTLAKSTIQAVRLQGRTAQQYEQTLDELLADIDRLARLAGQLLDLARVEDAGGGAREDVAVGELLARLVQRYEAQVEAAGGRVVCELSGEPLSVRGNPGSLESLFANLIDNAAKHGPRGGTITLRSAADGRDCLVTVHDEGGQIPADQIGRLFDRFYRVDPSHSHATGGSGLGLAIARQIARQHGGEIRIASRPEEGTTVSVRLPRVNAD